MNDPMETVPRDTSMDTSEFAVAPHTSEPHDSRAGRDGDESNTAETPVASLKKKQPKAKRKLEAETIEDLLRLVYSSNARQIDFPREDLRKLRVVEEDEAAQNDLVRVLAREDPTLDTPVKILQLVAMQGIDLTRPKSGDFVAVLLRLVNLTCVALASHPLFHIQPDQLMDPERQPQVSAQLIREEAKSIDAVKLGLQEDKFASGARERLARNGIVALGLLRILQRAWTLERFIEEMLESVWKKEIPSLLSLEREVGEISASRDLGALGITGNNFQSRLAQLDQLVVQLEREAHSAAIREERLNEELRKAARAVDAATARAEAFSADIVRLQKELAAERDNRVVDKSHMADDYETLRTRIVRRLAGEIDLLTDGLHALRNGAPVVAEEFLDRSLVALTREVEQLKDAAGGLS